uniref:F-box domain-containing protein n=1 Tax=Ananas comosus var. bracteatus TaxID=296719 RepID=A0A6V7PFA6_ANACO|nr:unnamed protein product [Ananas comosus var. bracteatus]
MRCVQRVENVAEVGVESSILDLPELALECVLEKLPPAALCSMAGVCRNFKERKNYLQGVERRLKPKSLIESISCIWPLSWIKPLLDSSSSDRPAATNPSPIDSIMFWYLALESGKLWFPAQVYNRENGHVGFVLSCYDAQLSYDRQTDTFYARYPPHGRKPVKMEEGIEWSRIRASPVDTSPHDLHVSDCLNDLRPGDHFEIQWRKSKEFPYGWWYGVVGHLESCDEREHHCCCHKDDTIILEFKQYAPGSKWRKKDISRKSHREKGEETDGFYGGIRKLQRKDEISIWKRFWPCEVLE